MKVLSKYFERLGSKCRLSTFPHYKSMENLNCHSKQTKELNFIKNKTCKVYYGEYLHRVSVS